MKKKLYNIEVINIVSAVNGLLADENKAKDLSIKIRWALKKNLASFMPTVSMFEDFRGELVAELQKEYFTEERSHPDAIETDQGVQEVIKVNDEWLEEYNAKVNELNERLKELLGEQTEYDISTVDMDAFIENLPNQTYLTFKDIETISFMDSEAKGTD